MPTFNGRIEGFAKGDDLGITRTICDLPAPITKSWLTVKVAESDPDPGLVQKVITTTDAPGTGQITDAGTLQTDGTFIAQVRFDLAPADTVLLDPGIDFYYDIQVFTNTSKTYTPEVGNPNKGGGIRAEPEVTLSSGP